MEPAKDCPKARKGSLGLPASRKEYRLKVTKMFWLKLAATSKIKYGTWFVYKMHGNNIPMSRTWIFSCKQGFFSHLTTSRIKSLQKISHLSKGGGSYRENCIFSSCYGIRNQFVKRWIKDFELTWSKTTFSQHSISVLYFSAAQYIHQGFNAHLNLTIKSIKNRTIL